MLKQPRRNKSNSEGKPKKMQAAINSIQYELEDTTKNQVEDVTSVDQQTQGLHKELNGMIAETQLGLQMTLDMRT
jgi:hypothetical protein